MRLVPTLVLMTLLLTVGAASASGAVGDMTLASRATGAGGPKGDADTLAASLSADGRRVAFASLAANLSPDDTDPSSDVYVRLLANGATALVSRADGAAGEKSDGDCGEPSISADGRFVAFSCDATNIAAGDTDATIDVFVRDLTAETTVLVSRASSGAKGDGASFAPAISSDGRFVAFESLATNLGAADGDAVGDVFVRDLLSQTTTLVSRASGADGRKGTATSTAPAISADGRIVAFSSEAADLDPADADAAPDVYVRDVVSSMTTLASRADGLAGAKGDGDSTRPKISADGRIVAFSSRAANLHPDDVDASADVFVRDRRLAKTVLVSRADGAAGAKGDGDSQAPSISASGHYVAFESTATNLHPDDRDPVPDVFVRELAASRTRLASRAAGLTGTKGDGESHAPSLAATGRFVSFVSAATNLAPDDSDPLVDVFVRETAAAPGPFTQPVEPSPPVAAPVPSASVAPGCTLSGARIVGTNGRDTRRGGAGTDIVFGLAGDDVLFGLAGDDCLYGQAGADVLLGGSGDDRLFGGAGRDRVVGGPGDDRLVGEGGADRLTDTRGRDSFSGGAGDDLIDARDSGSLDRRRADSVRCGSGRHDRALADRSDLVAHDCERVQRRSTRER